MNISKYLSAGYAALYVEALEIKRAVKSIMVKPPFEKIEWNMVSGLTIDGQSEDADQLSILQKATELQQKAIILENYDFFLENPTIIQMFLNNYELCKANQVCLVIVGHTPNKIPTVLKELIPIIQFNLPDKEEVKQIVSTISKSAEEDFKQSENYEKVKNQFDFSYSDEVISACLGLSNEEIENALSLSLIEYKRFDIKSILDRKRQIIKSTGFMDFMNPEPIENLGGLDKLKEYVFKRKEAFVDGSNKPKLKSMLICGIPGTGKTLSSKAIASIFDWPLISLDIGALKGGIVGQTEQNVRLACKTIDAFGKAVVQLEEIEKSLAGAGGQSLDSGVSQGLFGYLLTWMQERQSEGILIATANDVNKLPPEFLRTGRFDVIWFVDVPNANEVKCILEIMNRRYHAKLPVNEEFCKELAEEQWTGAEIEQLAKDSHFDDLETAMNNIPLLADFRKDDMDEIRKKAKQFRAASSKDGAIRKKIQLKPKLDNKVVGGRKLKLN